MPQPPSAPLQAQGLRGDYSHAAADYTVAQDWDAYGSEDHAIWAALYRRQMGLIERYAAQEFLCGARALAASPVQIPRFEAANRTLAAATGWRIVAVPGLIPEANFFDHLAHRRFPVTVWIRRREELDYLVEPDVFHDFFGHVPLLMNPVFARFMQAYGEAGPRAMASPGGLAMLARLYWYMVEFGLIRTPAGLRVYGSGILSSKGETVHSIESPVPRRLRFELVRVMRTDYRIDEYQPTYFVLESFEQLFEACYRTDFTPLYQRYGGRPPFAADARVEGDVVA
ncbi:MAG TPA: phenylalanine 4-monooxygenase [Steroidobacteraceae bacterium]|nr:phenylalanine 4-monooxygenase [Steroidobacteraceae bacterium]